MSLQIGDDGKRKLSTNHMRKFTELKNGLKMQHILLLTMDKRALIFQKRVAEEYIVSL